MGATGFLKIQKYNQFFRLLTEFFSQKVYSIPFRKDFEKKSCLVENVS
jgi:hypothetical protein